MEAPSVFVGRKQELAPLWEVFARADKGRLGSSVIYGEAGAGKSALLHHFLEAVRSSYTDAVVLSCRCHRINQVPYQVASEITAALGQRLLEMPSDRIASLIPSNVEQMVRVFPALQMLAGGQAGGQAEPRSEVIDSDELLQQAFLGLRQLLAQLAQQQPLMIIIDDLQWADTDSLKQHRVLLQPPNEPAICLIAALRTSSETWEAKQQVRKVAQQFPPKTREIEVPRLLHEEAHQLVERLLQQRTLGRDVDGDLVQRITARANGHPLFIRELVHHVQSRGVPRLELEPAIWQRIVSLSPAARGLIELLSVAEAPLDCRTVAETCGLTAAELTQYLQKLEAEDLLYDDGDKVRTQHEVVRDAVLKHLSQEDRRRWHRRLADVLAVDSQVSPELLAVHFEGAGDHQTANRYIVVAAHQADEALAFVRAAGLYNKAVATWTGEVGERRKLLSLLADKLAQTGQAAKAGKAYLAAVSGAEADRALVLQRCAGEQLLRAGYVDEGLEALGQVLSTLGMQLPRTNWGALVSLVLRRMQIRTRGLRFKERDESQVPIKKLARVDACRTISQLLSAIDHIVGGDYTTRYVLASLSAGEPHRALHALGMEAVIVAASGGIKSRYFRRIIRTMEEHVDRRDDPTARVYLAAAVALGTYIVGEWRIALESCRHAESLADRSGSRMQWETSFIRNVTFWTLYYLGELDELSTRVPPLVQEALDRGDLFSASNMILGLLNIVYLNQEGPQQARHHIAAVMRRWSSTGFHLQHYYAMLSETLIDLYQGEGIRAHERVASSWPALKRSQLFRVPTILIEATHLRARAALAAAAEADPFERRSLLAQAERDARRMTRKNRPWTGALALLVRAGVSALNGRDEQAVYRLERSVEELESYDMKLFAAAARRRLAPLVGGGSGAAHMKAAEAFMSAQGVSDPEAMTALFVPGFSK